MVITLSEEFMTQ